MSIRQNLTYTLPDQFFLSVYEKAPQCFVVYLAAFACCYILSVIADFSSKSQPLFCSIHAVDYRYGVDGHVMGRMYYFFLYLLHHKNKENR